MLIPISQSPAHKNFETDSGNVTREEGFTLIELIIVISLVVLLFTLVVSGLGFSGHLRDEAFIRKLAETIEFLHDQAIADQAFYRLEFDIRKDGTSYTVGVMRPEEESDPALASFCSSEAGNLSCELAAFLSPSLGVSQTVIPPPDYPSLAEKTYLPDGMSIEDVKTMRGEKRSGEDGKSFIMFSPRGFSEFAVIHLKGSGGAPLTLLVNPFSGNTKIYRAYRQFDWKYGKKESAMK